MIRSGRLVGWWATASLILAAGAACLAGCGSGAGARPHVSAASGVTAAATPSRTPASHAASGGRVWLDTVQMVSLTTGWALIWTSNPALPDPPGPALARTTDGGRTWAVVTPPAAARLLANAAVLLGAVTARRAWLAVAPYSGRLSTDTLVFGTGNSGASWTAAAPVRGSQPIAIDFISPSRGWLLDSPGAALGTNPVRLYGSSDGGAHWSLVAASAAATAGTGSASGIPAACDKSGLSFGSALSGWITGYCNGLAGAVLESTDGGVHWMSPSLPVRADLCQPGGCAVAAPQFAGTATFLQISAYPAAADLLVSADGGGTWTIERLPAGAGPYPRLRFFSASDGIAVSAGSQGVIGRDFYLTTNGGRSWTAVRQGRRFGADGASFDFVSPRDGFAWVATQNPQSRLYVTADSGHSWQTVVPRLG